MLLNHVILAVLWIVYCLLHSVLASKRVKKSLQEKFARNYKFYRLFYTFFSFAFLVALLFYQVSLPTWQIFNLSAFSLICGFLISFAGLIIMITCIGKYFVSLSGLRSLMTERPSHELMISGIHRYVRHPLYLGTFAFIWGLFLVMPYLSLLITNTIITVYTLIGIGLEERKLVAEFGESYEEYRSKVPKLLPLLKPKR